MTKGITTPPAPGAQATRIPTPHERAEEIARFERQADRDRFRDYLRTSVECMAWSFSGLVCIGWSFHTTDMGWGQITFYGGLVIGNGGILVSLYCANQRALARGDVVSSI
jgi:hypothetical protein